MGLVCRRRSRARGDCWAESDDLREGVASRACCFCVSGREQRTLGKRERLIRMPRQEERGKQEQSCKCLPPIKWRRSNRKQLD